MGKGIKVIHQDCDASLSEDKTLPYSAYLVEYIEVIVDIVNLIHS